MGRAVGSAETVSLAVGLWALEVGAVELKTLEVGRDVLDVEVDDFGDENLELGVGEALLGVLGNDIGAGLLCGLA